MHPEVARDAAEELQMGNSMQCCTVAMTSLLGSACGGGTQALSHLLLSMQEAAIEETGLQKEIRLGRPSSAKCAAMHLMSDCQMLCRAAKARPAEGAGRAGCGQKEG